MSLDEQRVKLEQALVEIGAEGFDQGFGAAVEILREMLDDTDEPIMQDLALISGVSVEGATRVVQMIVEALAAAQKTTIRAAVIGMRSVVK